MHVTRTVKDGKVTIFRRQYGPDDRHLPYNGELEGCRLCFGLYDDNGVDFVALWGTEDEWRAGPESSLPQPYMVDGMLPWVFWPCVSDSRLAC